MMNHMYQAGNVIYIVVPSNSMLKQDVMRGTIRAFYNENGLTYAVVERDDNHELVTVPAHELYPFEQDAASHIYTTHYKQLHTYLADIHTINDLIRFAYEHNVSSDSTCDWTARIAYQLKAKELTGLQL